MKLVKVLGCIAVLALAAGIVLHISQPTQAVKASSGAPCSGFCTPPPLTSPCTSGGGTPPFNGQFGYGYGPAQGSRAILKFNLVSGCEFFVTNLNGSIVTNNPSGNEVASIGIWETSDANCGTSNLTTPYFVRVAGTNSYHLSEQINTPAGVDAVVPYNASAPYVCVGYSSTSSDWWQTENFGYGYE